ncbi:MAG: hypothetical protein ACOC9T_00255 [Myxococcota bacterium]
MGEVSVFLLANVCVGGRNYGPDYGTRLLAIPEADAKVFMRRGDARRPRTGPCTRDGQRCDAALDPVTPTPPCCVQAALATLRKFAELAEIHDVTWWADYGTLLGAACGGRFYWNDKDCDIGVLAEDQGKVLRMRSAFTSDGFRFSYAQPRPGRGQFRGGDRVKIRYSQTHHANTDVFFWHLRGAEYHRTAYIGVDRTKGREFPADWLHPMTTLAFEGIEVPVPGQWEKLVRHRYPALGELHPDPEMNGLPAARTDGVKR